MTPHPSLHTGRSIACALAAAFLLTGCNLPQAETPAPAPLPLPTLSPTPCSLIAPGIPIPDTLIHETLRPALTWVYHGACAPDGFRVEVAPGGDFESLGVVTGLTPPEALSWSPVTDLAPATLYAWRVAGVIDGAPGPWSVSDPFWTGPTCGGADLQPPIPVAPVDGIVVREPSPLFEWDYPPVGCLQAHYAVEVSASPLFDSEALYAGVGPDPSFETEVAFLEDCAQYYWRVKAVYGEDISGPYSAVSTFYADLAGTCGAQARLPRLSGIIWSDVCSATGSPSPVAPPGCVWREGGLGPDGIRQSDEAPLPGLLVRVAPGLCTDPGIGWTTEPTDESGAYAHFVTPGTYCVWTYRDRDGNDAILGRGRWTYPPGGYDSPVRYEIVVAWGEDRTDLDFGWVFLP